MKKFFSMMMIAVAALSFASCEEIISGLEPDDKPAAGTQLETPAPKAEVGDTYFTVSWEAITGADSYTVNLRGKNYTTTETSYKFENLNAGEYTVNVKATGEGYKDSAFGSVVVTLTGATSVDWFESTVAPAEENAEEGYGPYNAVAFTWKGTGVKSLSYGLYISENLIGVSDKDIKEALTAIGDKDLATVNSANGLSAVLGPISGGTTYTMCLLVTNEKDVEFFSMEEVTTETAQPSAEAQAWVGAWTVNSTQKYSIDQSGKGTVVDGADTFTVNIYPSANHPNQVAVDGMSVLGEGFIATGEVEGDTLYILNGDFLGMSQDGTFGFYWLAWFSIDGGEAKISMDAYPSNVVTLDGDTATSTNKFNLYYEDGTPAPTVCYCSEVFGLDDAGKVSFFIDAFPALYRTGDMTWTKSAASAQALNIDAMGVTPKALQSSVVLR